MENVLAKTGRDVGVRLSTIAWRCGLSIAGAILLVSASAVVSGLGQGGAGGEDVGEYFADAVKEENGCDG